MVGLKANNKALLDDFKITIQFFQEDIIVLKKIVLQETLSSFEDLSKIHVPKLKGFNDNRNVKELENFL